MNPRLPPCALTGIGSLPFVSEDRALALSTGLDVPFLPELPQLDPSEFMIPAALRGFESGVPDLTMLERFLKALPGPRWIKLQMSGPSTLSAFAKGVEAGAIGPWLALRGRAMITRARSAGHEVIFVLDEPALANSPVSPEEAEVLGALREVGARVGLHCCGNTDWGRLLGLPLDYLSLDVHLSLDALLAHREAWRAFEGALMLGVVPTNPGATWDSAAIATKLEAVFTPRQLERSLLTPACGLALHSVASAEAIIAGLRQVQRRLQR